MSHPATLLKKYLTELDERIGKLNVKSEGGIQTVSESVSKLDQKLDGDMHTANENLGKLDSKLDEGIRTVSESVSKLDQKLDDSVQTTNQAIGELCREKLSVQEFREFVNAFNKILGENLLGPEKPALQTSEPALRESYAEDNSLQGGNVAVLETKSDAPQNTEASSSQTVEDVTPQIIVEGPASEINEKASLPRNVTVGEGVSKHFGFPMKVVGEFFYVGDGVTSIVGDVEIPPGTTVDETLVVKGNFKSHECCRLLNNVKALKDIEIGKDTTVEGTLVSGGKVTVNSNCVLKGSIESDGDIEIGENVIVKENLSSKSAIVLSKSAQVLRFINAAKGILRP
jgi:predicted acyltransferase (DUF342 family)